LTEIGLQSWVKTSGSKGFHIVVPLDGKAPFDAVAKFAEAVGALVVARDPAHLTQEFSKANRGGRILVDTRRNGYSATFAAVYAVRPKPGAPVSAPCTWAEIERGKVDPRTFTLGTMAGRMAHVGDLWADLRKRRYSLTRAVERMRRVAGGTARRSS
jgi:bifunctional non-homologous end joining protein LigD